MITRALHDGVADLDRAPRGRPDALAMGRRAPRRVSASGARLGGACCGRCSADRSRTPATGARSTSARSPSIAPTTQEAVPGYRQIIDLSPANNSRFIDAVGESGHFLSPHYDDFMADWRDVRDRKMRMTRADVDDGALGRLVLTPGPAN